MSCRIRAVQHRKSAAGLAGAHPGLKDRILLNYCTQALRMPIKYAKKLPIFSYAQTEVPAETLLNAWMHLC